MKNLTVNFTDCFPKEYPWHIILESASAAIRGYRSQKSKLELRIIFFVSKDRFYQINLLTRHSTATIQLAVNITVLHIQETRIYKYITSQHVLGH